MPVNWTAENDRLLLLKLIETHGITINADKIAEAWPKDVPAQPTARAIKERFVKIRQLCAADGHGTPKGKMKLSNAPRSSEKMSISSTPKSTPRKRKATKNNDSESDADGHMTPDASDENETPSKARKTYRTPGRKPKPYTGTGNNGMSLGQNSPMTKMESQDPLNAELGADRASFSQFRTTMNDSPGLMGTSMPLQYGGYSIATPGDNIDPFGGDTDFGFGSRSMAGTDSRIDPSTTARLDMGLFGENGGSGVNNMNMGMGMNTGYMHSSMGDMTGMTSGEHLPHSAQRPILSSPATSYNSANALPVRSHVVSSTPTSHIFERQRSARPAREKAAQGLSDFIKKEKEIDRELGDKSSVENSAASSFAGDDGNDDFI